MYECMYVCVNVCMCVCVCVSSIHVYIYLHTRVCIYVCSMSMCKYMQYEFVSLCVYVIVSPPVDMVGGGGWAVNTRHETIYYIHMHTYMIMYI